MATGQKRSKRRFHKLLLIGWIGILLTTLVMPTTALAWKPTTHVYLADLALQDALDDGKVTIYRVDYEQGTILSELGQYQVDETILGALRSNRAQYRAGILGPDAYPDILTGQQVIHPEPLVSGVEQGSNAWLQYLWEQSMKAENDTPAIRAFVVGYLTHAAGDMFGHTFINYFTGAPFAIEPPAGPENAIKHVVVEGYVDKRLPREALDADFFTASIDGVDDFIYRVMVDARPGTELDRQLLRSEAKATDSSVPRLYSTLRAALQSNQDTYPAVVKEFDRRADDCGWDPRCIVPVKAERTLYDWWAQYEKRWLEDIDDGLQAWPSTSHEVAKALFFNPDRRADTQKAEKILEEFSADHLLSMSGSPDEFGSLVGDILTFLSSVRLLVEPFEKLKEDLLNVLLEAAIGMTKQDLERYLTEPDKYFNQVMTKGAGENVTLEQFNSLYLNITDPGYTDPAESFDYRKVPAAYNTATMSKLILLAPSEVNRLLSDLGSATELDTPNIMMGFIRTLDGDNQWANGMVLARDCKVYTQVFMRQPGDRGLSNCPSASGDNASAFAAPARHDPGLMHELADAHSAVIRGF